MALSRSFQIFYGYLNLNSKHYLAFSYHSANLNHLINHYSNNQIDPQEEILLKILKNCYKCFTLCKRNNSFFPNFDHEHVLVEKERKTVKSLPPRQPRTWNLEKRETVVMHPFMFKSFLKQISQNSQRGGKIDLYNFKKIHNG